MPGMESDLDYYTRRLGEERKAIEAAADEGIRQPHAQMAEAYELKLKTLRGDA